MNYSNEVLNIDFGEGAAEISEVKLGGQKKSADLALFESMRPRSKLEVLQAHD